MLIKYVGSWGQESKGPLKYTWMDPDTDIPLRYVVPKWQEHFLSNNSKIKIKLFYRQYLNNCDFRCLINWWPQILAKCQTKLQGELFYFNSDKLLVTFLMWVHPKLWCKLCMTAHRGERWLANIQYVIKGHSSSFHFNPQRDGFIPVKRFSAPLRSWHRWGERWSGHLHH